MPTFMKLFTVYRTTNNLNGKYYIGVHETFNPYDSYMGSGTHIARAIKKHGRRNFTKSIIAVFDNPKEMLALEYDIVDPADPMGYNLGPGGAFALEEYRAKSKGYKHSEETKAKIGNGNRDPDEATRKRMSESALKRCPEERKAIGLAQRGKEVSQGTRDNLSWHARNRSPETRKKISVALTGKKLPPFTDEHRARISSANKGKVRSPEIVQRMREEGKRRWELTKLLKAYEPQRLDYMLYSLQA